MDVYIKLNAEAVKDHELYFVQFYDKHFGTIGEAFNEWPTSVFFFVS